MVSLSVIVPATNQPATLPRCLDALRRGSVQPDELIVVDGPRGDGPAAARNSGAQRASGDVLVFVDADVEAHGDALERIREAFSRNPDLSAVFGSYDDAPGSPGLISDFRNLLHHHVHQEGEGDAGTFWAGLGAIRRHDFEAVGGFDETRFAEPSVEDIELGMRLAARGARIRLEPQIQGKHLKRWTFTNMVRTDFARRGVPWMRLILEGRGDATALNLSWRNRASAVASLAVVGSLAARRPILSGGAVAAFLALNASFYGKLLDRGGTRQLISGVPLHVVHHIVGVAAVPAALALHLRSEVRRARDARRPSSHSRKVGPDRNARSNGRHK